MLQKTIPFQVTRDGHTEYRYVTGHIGEDGCGEATHIAPTWDLDSIELQEAEDYLQHAIGSDALVFTGAFA